MKRDREGTRRGIVEATGRLIAREGVAAARINAIAEEAGVDKVLIYRYFGGLDGLLRAVAREERFWPVSGEPSGAQNGTLASELTAALITRARALREQPLARRAAAWALEGEDEFAREVAAAREVELRRVIEALRTRHQLPRYLDLEAVVAIFSAGLSQLAVHSASTAAIGYAGLDLRQESGWRRIERALAVLVNSLLATTGD